MDDLCLVELLSGCCTVKRRELLLLVCSEASGCLAPTGDLFTYATEADPECDGCCCCCCWRISRPSPEGPPFKPPGAAPVMRLGGEAWSVSTSRAEQDCGSGDPPTSTLLSPGSQQHNSRCQAIEEDAPNFPRNEAEGLKRFHSAQ
ncbi:hypothetical protein JOB18_004898 [Solea senegalensis]|uniref:Uncharacterized protein n=1 Tax=Solea senegalensis TaxID=28829 RepID=A0AAV6QBZ2_SOLSE|nr:hypothetical protein JOB18_004898 [Solea senegalensis]